ncbi:MAG TPA: hypothetical protein VHG91_20735 [Longimicrobium sp.]|nr:hypothetical protein [Longimicrobium sp.]
MTLRGGGEARAPERLPRGPRYDRNGNGGIGWFGAGKERRASASPAPDG